MKWIIFIVIGVTSIFFLSNTNDNCYGGRCSGGANCYACKNCSGCKHCAQNGGECSVCAKPKKKLTNASPTLKKTVVKKKAVSKK